MQGLTNGYRGIVCAYGLYSLWFETCSFIFTSFAGSYYDVKPYKCSVLP